MHSSDLEPDIAHILPMGKFRTFEDATFTQVRQSALPHVRLLWEMMRSKESRVPLGHDGYLKLWALSNPVLDSSYILLDEAQDSNPVLLGILSCQSAQMVYVGDPYQQIYEWRNAVNAMETVSVPAEAYLSQSFRFGEGIAQGAWKVLSLLGASKPIRGNPQLSSEISSVDQATAILCRSNAGVMSRLLGAIAERRKPFVLGGARELQRLLRDVSSLKRGIQSDLPEFVGFQNWAEVVEFSEQEEGLQLKTLVQLVNLYGEDRLLEAVNLAGESEKSADVIISTAHKAKGREWDRVILDDDFEAKLSLKQIAKMFAGMLTQKQEADLKAELRLFYVALTRATRTVQIPHFLGGLVFDK